MANIKEMTSIFDTLSSSPKLFNQAMALRGRHGVGKSEFVSSYFEEKGYRVITLFLGQLSDAGDLLGLPYHEKVGDVTVTKFAKPDWWPKNKKDKVVLFLDEFNRANQEVMQAVFELALNRTLAGDKLPDNCHVIAAMNPADSNYDTVELDVALLDRFNLYEFKPTVQEWIRWATDNRLDKSVIGFIHQNKDYLEILGESVPDEVTPSRRSWTRVSDIIKANPQLKEKQSTLITILSGIVGMSASAKFSMFLKEDHINIGSIMLNLHTDKDLYDELKTKMTPQLSIHLNQQIEMWLYENIDEDRIHESITHKKFYQITKNLETYLTDIIKTDVMAEFINRLMRCDGEWGQVIMTTNENIAGKLVDIAMG
jgi:hypothetical protein